MGSPVRESQLLQVFHGHLVPLLPRNSLIIKGKFHVLHRCFKADEVEALEHEADHPVTVVGGLFLGQVPDQLAVQPVFTRVVIVQDAEDVEEGGLAGARRAHDGNELSPFDGEVDALEHVERLPVIVSLVDVFQFDQHFACISMLLHCKDKRFSRNGQIFLQIFGLNRAFLPKVSEMSRNHGHLHQKRG